MIKIFDLILICLLPWTYCTFFLECFECLCCCEIPKVKEKPWLQTVRLVSVWKRCQNLDTFCMILQTFYRPEMIKTIWRAFTSVRGLSGDCGGSVPLVFVSPWVFGANRPVVEWHSEWLNAWRNLQTRLFFCLFNYELILTPTQTLLML